VPVSYSYGVYNPRYEANRHTGEDRAAPLGTRIVAAWGGRVIETGYGAWGPYYGYQVIIESEMPGGETRRHGYCHMSDIECGLGPIQEGDLVGRVGATGNSTGYHLHYEERTYPFSYANRDREPYFSHHLQRQPESPWSKGDVYVPRLHKGRDNSDSVRRLQYRLRNHQDHGTSDLPITGNYATRTVEAVRRWQRNVAEVPPNDGSEMPEAHARRLFGDAYRLHMKVPGDEPGQHKKGG